MCNNIINYTFYSHKVYCVVKGIEFIKCHYPPTLDYYFRTALGLVVCQQRFINKVPTTLFTILAAVWKFLIMFTYNPFFVLYKI